MTKLTALDLYILTDTVLHSISHGSITGSNPVRVAWEISSVVEQCADNAEVGGSNPPFPT